MKKIFSTYFVLSLLSFQLFAGKMGSIVLDADTGKVYHDANADTVCYPASLTKMMTLYLLFEAIENKKTTLYHRMPVSKHAASQEPTKIHVKAGERLLVKQAIEAIAVKSANDASVVVAEYLSGTEAEFAERMTRKARELGMNNTYFKNANGLPNPLQRTTPRDLAKLGLALMHHFPHYYKFFATKQFNYRGRTYRNHNRMLFSYAGCTGLKTGYIRASGFNLAATATRENKRLIGVVVGEKSPTARAERMSRLLNSSFTKCGVKTKGANCVLQSPREGYTVCSIPGTKMSTASFKTVSFSNEESLPAAQSPDTSCDSDMYLELGTYKNFTDAEHFVEKAILLSNNLITKDNVQIAPCTQNDARYRVKIVDVAPKAMDDLSKIYKTYNVPCLKLQATQIDDEKIAEPVVKKALRKVKTKNVKKARAVPQQRLKQKIVKRTAPQKKKRKHRRGS